MPLATLHFAISWHQKRMTLPNFLQNKQSNVQLSNIALLILQKTLQSHAFLMSRTQNCQLYGVKQIKSIFAEKRDSGTRFGAPLYFLKYRSSGIFNNLITKIRKPFERIKLPSHFSPPSSCTYRSRSKHA